VGDQSLLLRASCESVLVGRKTLNSHDDVHGGGGVGRPGV